MIGVTSKYANLCSQKIFFTEHEQEEMIEIFVPNIDIKFTGTLFSSLHSQRVLERFNISLWKQHSTLEIKYEIFNLSFLYLDHSKLSIMINL